MSRPAGAALNKMKENLHEVIQSIADSRCRLPAQASTQYHQSADHRQLGRNLGPGRCRFQGCASGQPEPPDRCHRAEENGRQHKGDRQERHRAARVATRRRQSRTRTTVTVSKLGIPPPRSDKLLRSSPRLHSRLTCCAQRDHRSGHAPVKR